jgi:hypothetical protein
MDKLAGTTGKLSILIYSKGGLSANRQTPHPLRFTTSKNLEMQCSFYKLFDHSFSAG